MSQKLLYLLTDGMMQNLVQNNFLCDKVMLTYKEYGVGNVYSILQIFRVALRRVLGETLDQAYHWLTHAVSAVNSSIVVKEGLMIRRKCFSTMD